ncbi:MAG: hypothetical protein J6E41_10695 [Lachnospiraceae bacterium]|nr:hypothetical protein [Lachnospiraceae bacterium]
MERRRSQSFFLGNLYARKKAGRRYLNKYRLICDVNGDLLVDTVELARGKSLQAVGLAMHVQKKAAGCLS